MCLTVNKSKAKHCIGKRLCKPADKGIPGVLLRISIVRILFSRMNVVTKFDYHHIMRSFVSSSDQQGKGGSPFPNPSFGFHVKYGDGIEPSRHTGAPLFFLHPATAVLAICDLWEVHPRPGRASPRSAVPGVTSPIIAIHVMALALHEWLGQPEIHPSVIFNL